MLDEAFKKLEEIEKKKNPWSLEFRRNKVWFYIRGLFMPYPQRPNYAIDISRIWRSAWNVIVYLIKRNHYRKIFFLMGRYELLEVYKNDQDIKRILFVHYEKNDNNRNFDAYNENDAYVLELLRYIFRKCLWIFHPVEYKRLLNKLRHVIEVTSREKVGLRIAMGEAYFLSILSRLISVGEVYYSGCVVPMGEKFVNMLNSTEIQHGVITNYHTGYIGLPEVKNCLMVYSARYKDLLIANNYKGEIVVNEYKNNLLQEDTERRFDIVIYTSGLESCSVKLEHFMRSNDFKKIYIQKHPRDNYKYNINEKYIVNNTIPSEVRYPIVIDISSIIENYTILNRTVYVVNLEPSFSGNYKEIIDDIYVKGTDAKVIYGDGLEEIYNIIMNESKNEKHIT